MRDRKRIELRRIVALLEQALAALDEQQLDVAAAHLDRSLEEVRRSLCLLQATDS